MLFQVQLAIHITHFVVITQVYKQLVQSLYSVVPQIPCLVSLCLHAVLLRPLADLRVGDSHLRHHRRDGGTDRGDGCHAPLLLRELLQHRHLVVQCESLTKHSLPPPQCSRHLANLIEYFQLYFFSLNQLTTIVGGACGLYSLFKSDGTIDKIFTGGAGRNGATVAVSVACLPRISCLACSCLTYWH